MDRLRPREKKDFTGFTTSEVEKMEKLLEDAGEKSLDNEFFKKLTRSFNCSAGRAGKPILKWAEVQSWLCDRQKDCLSKDTSLTDSDKLNVVLEPPPSNNRNERSQVSKVEKDPDLSQLEFEARSSKDKAWYDVETFLSHRFLASGEVEVQVRYVGFGSEEDEWVNVKRIRERSLALDNSECERIKVGDLVLCFQEKTDQARYYDAHVVDVKRKLHDIRGCRCLFLIKYDHDNAEESVRLKRLCCRASK